VGDHTLRSLMLGVLLGSAIAVSGARADDSNPISPAQPNLVKAANAPISAVLQVRLEDAYAPKFVGLTTPMVRRWLQAMLAEGPAVNSVKAFKQSVPE
jgi:hypothetical protein